jgi:hypothetical protein
MSTDPNANSTNDDARLTSRSNPNPNSRRGQTPNPPSARRPPRGPPQLSTFGIQYQPYSQQSAFVAPYAMSPTGPPYAYAHMGYPAQIVPPYRQSASENAPGSSPIYSTHAPSPPPQSPVPGTPSATPAYNPQTASYLSYQTSPFPFGPAQSYVPYQATYPAYPQAFTPTTQQSFSQGSSQAYTPTGQGSYTPGASQSIAPFPPGQPFAHQHAHPHPSQSTPLYPSPTPPDDGSGAPQGTWYYLPPGASLPTQFEGIPARFDMTQAPYSLPQRMYDAPAFESPRAYDSGGGPHMPSAGGTSSSSGPSQLSSPAETSRYQEGPHGHIPRYPPPLTSPIEQALFSPRAVPSRHQPGAQYGVEELVGMTGLQEMPGVVGSVERSVALSMASSEQEDSSKTMPAFDGPGSPLAASPPQIAPGALLGQESSAILLSSVSPNVLTPSSNASAPRTSPSAAPVSSKSAQSSTSATPAPAPATLSSAQESKPKTGLASASERKRPMVRRPYHPNPPPQRSEWVMWSGNVPSDATQEELWRFFNQVNPDASEATSQSTGRASSAPATPPRGSDRNNNSTSGVGSPGGSVTPDGPSTISNPDGVVSIFLIARSNCAFINFRSERGLLAAIATFNGRSLRPQDPQCPRLVCRIRKVDDDLKAGVGGQRGMGIHTRWAKEQKAESDRLQKERKAAAAAAAAAAVGDTEDDVAAHESDPGTRHSTSSGSFASTSSNFLAGHFPRRFFILKSLSQVSFQILSFHFHFHFGSPHVVSHK